VNAKPEGPPLNVRSRLVAAAFALRALKPESPPLQVQNNKERKFDAGKVAVRL
jgi:hypothetical protein